MTVDTAHRDRVMSDPAGLITDLVMEAGPGLGREQVREVVSAVAGGRAKSRRLALALAGRTEVLADGRSPAPRAVADLLVALHDAGSRETSLPACAQYQGQLSKKDKDQPVLRAVAVLEWTGDEGKPAAY